MSTKLCKDVRVKKKNDLVRINPRIPRALSKLLREELDRSGVKMEFFVTQAISEKLGRALREQATA